MSTDDGKINLGPLGSYPPVVVIISGVIVGAMFLGFCYLLVKRQIQLCRRGGQRRQSTKIESGLSQNTLAANSAVSPKSPSSKKRLISMIPSSPSRHVGASTRSVDVSEQGETADIGSGLFNRNSLLPQDSKIEGIEVVSEKEDSDGSSQEAISPPLKISSTIPPSLTPPPASFPSFNPSSKPLEMVALTKGKASTTESRLDTVQKTPLLHRQRSSRPQQQRRRSSVIDSPPPSARSISADSTPLQRRTSKLQSIHRHKSTRTPKATLLGDLNSSYRAPSGTLLSDDHTPLRKKTMSNRSNRQSRTSVRIGSAHQQQMYRNRSERRPKQTLLGDLDSGYKAPSGTLLSDDNAPLNRYASVKRH